MALSTRKMRFLGEILQMFSARRSSQAAVHRPAILRQRAFSAALSCVVVFVSPSFAEDLDLPGEVFKDLGAHFTVFVPGIFELFEPPRLPFKTAAPVALFLRPADQALKYPTFNVLENPGTLLFEDKSETELAGGILKSYRLVGILSSQVLAAELEGDKDGEQSKFHAELRYKDQNLVLRSGVTLIPGYGRHYILTFVDLDQNFEQHRAYWDVLRKTFSPIAAIPGAASNHPPLKEASSSAAVFIALWAVLLLAAGAVLLRKYRSYKSAAAE